MVARAMSRFDWRRAIASVSLLIAGCCACAAAALAQTTVPGEGARAAPDAGEAAYRVGGALAAFALQMFVAFMVLVVVIRVVFVFWPGGKPYAWIAYTGGALLVVVLSLMGVGMGYGNRTRQLEHASAAPAPAPAVPPAAPITGPSPARPDPDQIQTFEGKGCKLSAPATWSVLAQPADSTARLVISSPTGEASVGIHQEPAAGTTLTKRDVAQLMEKANRMPLRLEDSNWSMLDNHDAWREIRTGAMGGTTRLWIRYSYHLGSAVIQVIGVASGTRSRQAREHLETILKSAHCEE